LKEGWFHAAFPLLLVLSIALHSSAVSDPFIDDAYISFRYAWNLSHGNGLVFNQGEQVEGYSSLAWVLLSSAFLKVGLPLEAGIRGTAVALLCLTALALYQLLLRLGASAVVALVSGLLLASTSGWVLPLLNGLEGPLFSFLLLSVTSLNWQNSTRTSPSLALATGGAGVLLAATRPEGYLIFLAQSATAFAVTLVYPKPSRLRYQGLALGTFATGFGVLTAWRMATYGSFVQNAVRAKLGSQPFARFLSGSLRGGLQYSLDFALAILPLCLIALWAVVWASRRSRLMTESTLTLLALAAVAWCCGLTVALANNGDWMPHYRLLAPYLPLLVIIPAALLIEVPTRLSLVIGLGTCFTLLSPTKLDRPSIFHLLDVQPSSFHRVWCRLGADLESSTDSPGNTVVASEVIGAFGYCAPRLRVRDLSGLTDRDIALNEPAGGVFGRKTRPASIEAMRPDALVTNDLRNWKQLVDESPWFAGSFVSLSCDALLADQTYAFVRRGGPFETVVIPSCPTDRMSPVDALNRANCLQKTWPYSFPRECAVRE
jgi:arabinofuranosyltransferase